MANEAVANRVYGEGWRVIKVRNELALGLYAEAVDSIDEALKRYSSSIQLRYWGIAACRHAGQAERERQLILDINRLYGSSSWRYSDADDAVTLGRTAQLVGADARKILEGFYDQARKADPDNREPWLASGQLALAKHDSELAASTFRKALQLFPEDPDMHFGMARAISGSDFKTATTHLAAALKGNPNHVDAILLQVERLVDSESYAKADEFVQKAIAVNPRHAMAWAWRAVIAHLEGRYADETRCRSVALSTWSANPEVDHLIGRKLSSKYRFAEGAAYQQKALLADPGYIPAVIQLSQDMLRLGREDEGWELAERAHSADGYDTTTFNLVQLHDALSKYQTLENENFILRMDPREARIYGDRVLKILDEAKRVLTDKYGLDLRDKVTVEIFADENDFAVRTFGLPDVAGFLGVCFGSVITANSPATRTANPSNWESILWHEFCHVVTLQLTSNRMPRWLSEGISVYEEVLRDRRWGQKMIPRYRELVINGELTPIGNLSAAFLAPKSPMHLQFAYFQSSLVVEHMIDEFGVDAIRQILADLKTGLSINDALERRTNGLAALDESFAKFVQTKIDAMAPGAEWELPDDLMRMVQENPNGLREFVKLHPDNVPARAALAAQLVESGEVPAAERVLLELIDAYPDDTSAQNASIQLAKLYRGEERFEDERRVLRDYMQHSADDLPEFLRLLELDSQNNDLRAMLQSAQRVLAVNPLLPQPHRTIAQVAEQLKRPQDAIAAWQTLIAMDPEDPAEAHFELARLLHQQRLPGAKKHALYALEAAPRYRDAHRLLLEIVETQATTAKGTVSE